MDVSLTNREPIRFGKVPCCDKLAIKEKPRSVRQDRTRGDYASALIDKKPDHWIEGPGSFISPRTISVNN